MYLQMGCPHRKFLQLIARKLTNCSFVYLSTISNPTSFVRAIFCPE